MKQYVSVSADGLLDAVVGRATDRRSNARSRLTRGDDQVAAWTCE